MNTNDLIAIDVHFHLEAAGINSERGAWRVPMGTNSCDYVLSSPQQVVSALGGSNSVNVLGASGQPRQNQY